MESTNKPSAYKCPTCEHYFEPYIDESGVERLVPHEECYNGLWRKCMGSHIKTHIKLSEEVKKAVKSLGHVGTTICPDCKKEVPIRVNEIGVLLIDNHSFPQEVTKGARIPCPGVGQVIHEDAIKSWCASSPKQDDNETPKSTANPFSSSEGKGGSPIKRKVQLTCMDVFYMPEFIALCQRLGIKLDTDCSFLSITLARPNDPVRIEQVYYPNGVAEVPPSAKVADDVSKIASEIVDAMLQQPIVNPHSGIRK